MEFYCNNVNVNKIIICYLKMWSLILNTAVLNTKCNLIHFFMLTLMLIVAAVVTIIIIKLNICNYTCTTSEHQDLLTE